MKRDPVFEHAAAAMLETLTVWILQEAAEFPIRSTFLDLRLRRATDVAEQKALSEYRLGSSVQASLDAGKRAFKNDFLGSHPSVALLVED
jgi:hypothetical protein